LFGPAGAELRGSTVSFNEPSASKAKLPDSTFDALAVHGTAVAGFVAAVGDNGSGTAGTLWGAAITRVQLFGANRSAPTNFTVTDSLTRWIKTAQSRVVSVSSDVPFGEITAKFGVTRMEVATAVERELRSVFAASPQTQFVLSLGNRRVKGTINDYIADDSAGVLTSGLLLVRSDSQLASHVVTVAGTNPDGRFADRYTGKPLAGSNFISGGLTDIAAPASRLLGLDTLGGNGLRAVTGTSFGTPQVAGTLAALLLADPGLTPASRKRYLLRGARSPRVSSGTGFLESRLPAKGATGDPTAIWQLDVYGTLALQAAESRLAPLCGQRIATDSAGTALRILRDSLSAENVLLPAGYSLRNAGTSTGPIETEWASVAQGGRVISINAQNAAGEPYLLTYALGPNGWVPSTPIRSDYTRTYLERDTAYVRWIPDLQLNGRFFPAGEIRRQRGGTLPIDGDRVRAELANRDQQFRPSTPTSVRVAPDGSAFAVTYTFGFADFCFDGQPIGAGLATFPLGNSAVAAFRRTAAPGSSSARTWRGIRRANSRSC
jgi:hypothetical protein